MKRPPTSDPSAPKGVIAPARAALLRFKPEPSWTYDQGYVDHLLKATARAYNSHKDSRARASALKALSDVVKTATAYANALSELNQIFPGYLSYEMSHRRPQGGRYEVLGAGGALQGAGDAPRDDIDIAFGPEIQTSNDQRPAHVLQPSIERARAVARLVAKHQGTFKGQLGGGRGKNNHQRDGRSPKTMLTEMCFLLVAGFAGPRGVAMITTTPDAPSHNPKEPPKFYAFVAAMHEYARGAEHSADENLEWTIKGIVPAMKAEIDRDRFWHSWIWLKVEPTAAQIVGIMEATFLKRLIDPSAKPPANSI